MVNFALAVFVLLQNTRSAVTRVFFLLGTSFAVWNFGTFWMFRVVRPEEALFWARFLQFGVIWIPLSLFHLSFLIAGINVSIRAVYIAYGLHFLLFLCNFTKLVVAGVRYVGYGWYCVGGPLFGVIFVIFSLMWISVFVLWRLRQTQPVLVRRRLVPLIVAQAAIAIFGSNDALPILGIDYYPFTHYQIYPFGSMAVIFYGVIVGYSVLQHQLLHVHVVLGRYSAHLVRMLFLLIIAFCLLLILAVLTKQFNTTSILGSLAVLMVSAYVAGAVFPRLLGGGSEDFERRLLGDHFEYQDQVKSFLNSMMLYSDLTLLRADLHSLLTNTFRLRSYQIILREEITNVFTLAQTFPEEPARALLEFRPESPVFRYFREGNGEYLALRRDASHLAHSTTERHALAQLRGFDAEFCFPFAWQDEPFGFLLTGRKISGDPFTATDIRLLIALAKNMSLVVNQIRLKNQVQHAQELELLGRMSRGMAHDLNNLLTPISTLLQLTEETGAVDDELLPVASRNLSTMRSYIREALFFSENLRPDLQPVPLDRVVRAAIEVAVTSRPKVVRVTPVLSESPFAEIDAVLVQRLIANLISNAIDASPAGAEVLVTLERTARIDEHREWLRVRVIDKGEGISRENLSRIFTPYFTTKDRGDQTRGFGLGLAICRKIATLHGGSLSIDSQLKKGTTVQLDLPSRQPLVPAQIMPVQTAA